MKTIYSELCMQKMSIVISDSVYKINLRGLSRMLYRMYYYVLAVYTYYNCHCAVLHNYVIILHNDISSHMYSTVAPPQWQLLHGINIDYLVACYSFHCVWGR